MGEQNCGGERPNRYTGFTIIELVVTLTVMAIISLAIVQIFVSIGITNRQAKHLAIATQQLQLKLESYHNQSYSAVPVGTPAEDFTAALPVDLALPRSAIVNVTESPAGLKLVDVKISYKEGAITKTVQATTYISLHGIGR